MRGRFISLEGVEGCGKSTQIERLKRHLEESGYRVDLTREPGGTPIGEAIRAILLDNANNAMCDVAELLLYEAARAQHIEERIRPAIEQGVVVISDRFADSTTAYQGAGRGLDDQTVAALHEIAVAGLWPDLTIVLDVPAREGLARVKRYRETDRIEQESLQFHERVRNGFLQLAEQNPGRIKVVDGARPADEVTRDVIALVSRLLESP